MNRQRYKLIFNRHRAMLIAVAETASSVAGQPGKNTARTGGMRASGRWCFSPLSLAMALAWSTVAHAQILVDRSAPASQQPSVITSGNGVPVINIRQANAKGLSVNRYRRFDVDGRGVILNNAGRGSQTELGGYVGGNPWLAGGGARVIVNQVHSSDASYLRGFVEVAGNKAQVIIANPSGITCAGCGFINVPRATLTTGTPIINGGDLESYRVGSGVLGVDGSGMDARSTDYTDLIARAVQVNARIWANRLKVSAGLNTVSADHAQVVAGVAPTDSAPVRAIDVAQLGGMYAGHIYLSATEHGVGVHNGGTLAATEGQLIVTAAGRLENTGTLAARIDTQINAAGAVSNTGTLGAENAVRLHAAALENRGSLSASQSLHVQIDGAVTNTGTLGGTTGSTLEAASLENSKDATIGSAGPTVLRMGGAIRNAGSIGGDTGVTLNAATLDNSGSLITPAALALRVTNGVVNLGKIGSNGMLNVRAGVLENRGELYSARSSVQLDIAGALFNNGSIEARQTLTAQAAAIENRGRFIGEDGLGATSTTSFIQAGTLGSKGAVELTAAGLDNTGAVSAGAALALHVADRLRNDKTIWAATDIRIDATTLENGGKLTTPGTLTMRIEDAVLNTGDLAAQGTVDVQATTLDNRKAIYSLGATVDLQASQNIHNTGTIEAAQSLRLRAGALESSGKLNAVTTMILAMRQRLANTGEIGSNDALTITASSLDNRGKLFSAKGAIGITTEGESANHGQINAAGNVTLTATEFDNSDGTMAGEDVILDTRPRPVRQTYADSRIEGPLAMPRSAAASGSNPFQVVATDNPLPDGSVPDNDMPCVATAPDE